ncbi:hypothetical protein [uncultured Methanobrevibacter sp.]|uniref:hypothetical protein n=1 Tax=uncultured Methanobrevibacter sp. TaxID=253161 RepID=UPI0025FCB6B3|nr:hypothetical protein [uncultured Methanobrevibacter sp.]MEE3490454.1 hypothetical protein [Methanobrevibacter sp.]
MSFIESSINMVNSSDDGFKKQKMFQEKYCEKKSYDMKIQDIKHEVNWSRDFFGFKNIKVF